MVEIILLFISICINIILFILLFYKNKQIKTIQKMRVAFEKRCNTFRLRYYILNCMEDNIEIVKNIRKLNKKIYIYGNGVIGKKLNNILKEDSDINVLGFIEGRELYLDKSSGEKIDKQAVIIVTPVFDYDNITKLLMNYTDKNNILSIDDILNEGLLM